MQIRPLITAVATVVLAAFIASGCGGENGILGVGGIPKDAACSVGGNAIPKKDLDALYKKAKQQYTDNGQEFPKKGTDEYKTLQNQALGFLIDQELFAQQADKFGIEVNKKDLDKRLKELKKNSFKDDPKKYDAELKRLGYSEKDVRADLEKQIRSEKLYEKVTKDIKITDPDIKSFYKENPKNFVTPESREVAHILVKDKALADKIHVQVKGGDQKLFTKLAKQHSEDPSSKDKGGVLTITRGQTVPEFDKMSFELKTGEISKPVKTSYGFHVITARSATTPEKAQPLKDVKEQIRSQLLQQDRSERYQEWLKNVKKDAENDVDCRKGFSWTQTVTETAKPPSAAPEPVVESEPEDEDAKKDDTGKDEVKKDDAKKDDASKDDAATDSAKTEPNPDE